MVPWADESPGRPLIKIARSRSSAYNLTTMPLCRQCGKELEEVFLFCPFCGKAVQKSVYPQTDRIPEEEWRTFIGPGADYYLNKFEKFSSADMERSPVSWNWAAFFFGFVWMLYRKMYLWALVSFILALTPIAFPLLMVLWGLTGNFLYYRHGRKKIMEVRLVNFSGGPTPNLAKAGGVNRWVWFVGIFFVSLLLALGILSGLLLSYLIRELFFHVTPFIQT